MGRWARGSQGRAREEEGGNCPIGEHIAGK